MIIEYEFREGWLDTPCPHGINITGQQVCQVGSSSCTLDCKHFVMNDKEKRVLTCSHPQGIFFLEYEETTPLHGPVRKVERFQTKEARNFAVKALEIWKSVKVTRIGQGVWDDV